MRLQVGVIIGIVVAGQALAQGELLQGNEPPGKLIDVGGLIPLQPRDRNSS